MIPRSEKTAQFQVRDGQFLAEHATRVSQAAEERTVRLHCRLFGLPVHACSSLGVCAAVLACQGLLYSASRLAHQARGTAGFQQPISAWQCTEI